MRNMVISALSIFIMNLPMACEIEGPRRGYWFYNECAKEEANEEKDKYALQPLPPHEAIMNMHPKEIAVMLEERLEYAVYKMTPESVVDYYKVIDASRRKSLAFTALTEYVMLKNPELNAKSQNPVTVPARKASTLIRNEEYSNYIAANKRDFALVMFSKESCDYCRIQEASLKHFQAKYGWKYKVVDVDLNPAIAIQFNATVTPTTALIRKATDEWMPVSVGAESVSEIEVGVYRVLRMLKNEISPTQFIMDRYREGGFFDPETQEGL
jgi:conjugal transfer pilus assembly protein TraF